MSNGARPPINTPLCQLRERPMPDGIDSVTEQRDDERKATIMVTDQLGDIEQHDDKLYLTLRSFAAVRALKIEAAALEAEWIARWGSR